MNGVGGGPQITPQFEQDIAKAVKKHGGETVRIGEDTDKLRFGGAKGKFGARSVEALEGKTVRTILKFNQAMLNTVSGTPLSERTMKALDVLLPNFVNLDGNKIDDFRVASMTTKQAHTLLEVTKDDREAAVSPKGSESGRNFETDSGVGSSIGSAADLSDFYGEEIPSYAESRTPPRAEPDEIPSYADSFTPSGKQIDEGGYVSVGNHDSSKERVAALREQLIAQEKEQSGTLQDEGIELDYTEADYASVPKSKSERFLDMARSGDVESLKAGLANTSKESFLKNLEQSLIENGMKSGEMREAVRERRIEVKVETLFTANGGYDRSVSSDEVRSKVTEDLQKYPSSFKESCLVILEKQLKSR